MSTMYDEEEPPDTIIEQKQEQGGFCFQVNTQELQQGWGGQFQFQCHGDATGAAEEDNEEPDVTQPTTNPAVLRAIAQQAFQRARIDMRVEDLQPHLLINPMLKVSKAEQEVMHCILVAQNIKTFMLEIKERNFPIERVYEETLTQALGAVNTMDQMRSLSYCGGMPEWCNRTACECIFMELVECLQFLIERHPARNKLHLDKTLVRSVQSMRENDRFLQASTATETKNPEGPELRLSDELSQSVERLQQLCRNNPAAMTEFLSAQVIVPPPVSTVTTEEEDSDQKME